MCGICGYTSFEAPLTAEDHVIIRRMNDKLIHRGPDAQDTLVFDHVALGFSRLSIIGLGNGMQPIFNEDRSLVLICNGEVFNYIELREELKAKGHVFRTDSDVEVIVHLYEDYGTEFLNKLNGQFAFALYDQAKNTFFCARDHMGIVPFYYTMTNGLFIFGSEIKSIIEHPAVKREVDHTGLDQVFTFAGIISPKTLFKNIHSLDNGHYLWVDGKGNLKKVEYWDLIFPEGEMPMNGKSEEAYKEELEALFDESVKIRLRSDVPSGIYLSGGLDSSAIAMKVSQFEQGQRKEAFSIDFVESEFSETRYQTIVANESNAKLNKKTFHFQDIAERLQEVIYHCECPIKESYNTASHSLSEAARARGIKVILSGEGSDELFAGYVGYRFDKMRQMGMVENPVTDAEKALRERLWGDPDFFYEKSYLEFEETKKSIYSDQVRGNYDQINCLNQPLVNKDRIKNRNLMNKRAYLDYKLRLVDHLVSDHGDRMALANSVEVRYPFLDKNLIEYSTSVPADLKLNDFDEKYIVKKMAESFVPQEVVRREKFGFVAPGSPYLLQNNVEYVNDILSYETIKRQGFFDPDQIESLKKIYSQDNFTLDVRFQDDLLITVITFGILLDHFFES